MKEMIKDKLEIQDKIKLLIGGFVEKHGNCDVRISSILTYEHTVTTKILIGINVDMDVII